MFIAESRPTDMDHMSGYMTRDEYEVTKPEPSRFPGGGSYVIAVLLPIVGVIFAIVALAKNEIGGGLALLATSGLAFAMWAYVFALAGA